MTEKILAYFDEDDIPLNNLISDLSDSTNYMRRKKGGVEALLREKIPTLLDIDGDTCHHMHNPSKRFCTNFQRYLEKLLDDVHNDTRWSPDILSKSEQGYLEMMPCWTH